MQYLDGRSVITAGADPVLVVIGTLRRGPCGVFFYFHRHGRRVMRVASLHRRIICHSGSEALDGGRATDSARTVARGLERWDVDALAQGSPAGS
jgi:hypothetical protein